MARQLRRDDYTVGWVCALPVELATAQEMLDEERHDLERDLDDNDENLYALGSIGGHNVAIVCLPAGQIGTVATQMRATFKKIRFGLMVGIGGGVPSAEANVRLGDVVVSQPHETFAGVVQYDMGKTTASGFKRTGALNSSPTILLAAVAKVRAIELRGRSTLLEHVSKLEHIAKFQRAKKQGVAPGDVAGSWRGQPANQKLHEHNALAIRTKSSELLTSGGVNRGVKRKQGRRLGTVISTSGFSLFLNALSVCP
jgi:nucleoside phosphorylase